MEKSVCHHCGSDLKSGMAVCGECGSELKEISEKETGSSQEERRGRKNIYAILTVFFVVVGGVALLIFSGLLPNPIKGGGSTTAIVNGVQISTAEVDQEFEVYKKMSGQDGKMDTSSPAGKAAMAEMMQILNTLIQEKILVTEAEREKITVSPQEIADRIAG